MENQQQHDRISVPEMILISGSGKNTGKTTLAELILGHCSSRYPVTGLKISPHFHTLSTGLKILEDHRPHYMLLQETDPDHVKDTSRMLRAGCKEVYMILSDAAHLREAFQRLYGGFSEQRLWICESTALVDIVTAGLLFYMTTPSGAPNSKRKPTKPDPRAHTFTLQEIDGQWKEVEGILDRWLENDRVRHLKSS